ncbi:hypothetical protein JOE61_000435 [Nocardioides salarius]|uniref:LppX_LprAFG lipoprotein n=1 Tax=Nocardioides salarius TaxID=374513 RepID=A0ABS2M602_9ACTN|nr:LppX_LprAFG lipoprotein [Nocardioides salarius]MBM7506621.1 hypothetical protein [Nocardioides salarius]
MKRTPTWRRTAVAAVLPLALTGLAACGGEESAEDTSSASAQLEEQGDEDGEEAGGLEAGDPVPDDDFVALMAASFEDATTARTTMTSETAGTTISAEGVVDYTGKTPAMRMTMESAELGDEPIEMILVDNVMYMQVPDLGGKYLSMDLDEPGNPLGPMMTDSMDPSKQAEMMRAGLESVTFVGEEDVDGESLEHYSATLDPSAALEGMQGMEGVPKSMMPEQMQSDTWFDDDGRVRRMVIDMGELGSTEMSMDDWGADVDIEAPPAGQVTTMDDMMGSMSQMS